MADIVFKYTAGKGEITPPTNADPNALYLTDGRLYKGNVLIADKSPDNYTWDKITAKPTTLAGYGIVDGATQSGYYPNMRVGLADDLGDIEERVDSEYLMQPTAKDENIRDGYAQIDSLKGNSVVWNQLTNRLSLPTLNLNGVVISYDDTEKAFVLNGTATSEATFYSVSFGSKFISNNHVAYCFAEVLSTNEEYLSLYIQFGHTNVFLTEKTFAVVVTDSNPYKYFRFMFKAGATFTNLKVRAITHDLTQMFGEGNEPTTIEEFERRKPQVADEYAYNEGEIISFDADAIKSVGFNQWDEEWEVGNLSMNTGENLNNNSTIRSKNYIKVIPDTSYFANTPVWMFVAYYDENKNFIGSTNFNKSIFTTPSNCHYMRFRMDTIYGTTYKNDICINLSNPAKNGTYEPYRKFTRNLPRRGELRSAGTAYDEIYYNHDIRKYVKVTRMGEVDLGDLNWRYETNFSYPRFSAIMPSGGTERFNIICSLYIANNSPIANSGVDKTMAYYLLNNALYIYNFDYTDAASFKSAMQGVKLIYELAEPIETILSDVEYMDFYVENGGTEQVLSENNTTPIRTTTVYNFDAVSTIRQNRFDVSELKSGYSSLETNISNLSIYVAQNTTAIDNIVNGTTAVGNASKIKVDVESDTEAFPTTDYEKISAVAVFGDETPTGERTVMLNIGDVNPFGAQIAVVTDGEDGIAYRKKSDSTWKLLAFKDDLGNAAAKNYTTSVSRGSTDLVTSGAVFSYVDSAIPSILPISTYRITNYANNKLYIANINFQNENYLQSLSAGSIVIITNPSKIYLGNIDRVEDANLDVLDVVDGGVSPSSDSANTILIGVVGLDSNEELVLHLSYTNY